MAGGGDQLSEAIRARCPEHSDLVQPCRGPEAVDVPADLPQWLRTPRLVAIDSGMETEGLHVRPQLLLQPPILHLRPCIALARFSEVPRQGTRGCGATPWAAACDRHKHLLALSVQPRPMVPACVSEQSQLPFSRPLCVGPVAVVSRQTLFAAHAQPPRGAGP